VVNFTTVACRISSRLKWYKNYKNRLRLAKVIVKNKMSRFLWFTVYSLAMTSKRHHLILMVADHHKSRAMLIASMWMVYSPRGEYSRRLAGEYSRQCEIALSACGIYWTQPTYVLYFLSNWHRLRRWLLIANLQSCI